MAQNKNVTVMSYEEFVETLTVKLPEYLPEELSKRMVIRHVTTTNQTRDIVTFEGMPGGKANVAPVIYLDDVYAQYCQNPVGVNTICSDFSDMVQNAIKRLPDVRKIEDQLRLDEVFMALINFEENQKLLESVPHRIFGDLAVVYKVTVSDDRIGTGSVTISIPLMESMGVSEELLYEAAMKNMRDLYIVERIEDALGLMPKDSVEPSFSDLSTLQKDSMMYVLGNRRRFWGAGILLMKKNIKALAEYLENDLVLIPSSVHEIIAVPDKDPDLVKTCISMVKEVNASSVEPRDRLSNSVYRYDRQRDSIQVFTQDGEVREITLKTVGEASPEMKTA